MVSKPNIWTCLGTFWGTQCHGRSLARSFDIKLLVDIFDGKDARCWYPALFFLLPLSLFLIFLFGFEFELQLQLQLTGEMDTRI